MERRRVLPDVNVCYPISLLDLVLRLDEAELHQIIWTDDLLNELAEVWVKHGARSEKAAAKVCRDIRDTFVGQDVPRSEYEHLIESMPGADPDDHAHAAAAVVRAPSTILTANTRDFPTEPLAELQVTVRHPDSYLSELHEQHPDELVRVIREMAADRSNPRMTPSEILDALTRAGVLEFARRTREHLDAQGH